MGRKTVRLTDSLIERTRPKAGQRIELWDTAQAGLGVRIGPRRKAWFFRYPFRAKYRRLFIGSWPSTLVDAAREVATEARRKVERGEDPAVTFAVKRRGASLTEFFKDHWLERHGATLAPRSLETAKQNFGRHVERTPLGSLPLVSVQPEDIETRLLAMKDAGLSGATRNRIRTLLQSVFSKAQAWRKFPADRPNPAKLAPRFKEETRERILTGDELAAIGRELTTRTSEDHPDATPCRLVKFLLLSGWRLSEACHLAWEDVHLTRKLATIRTSKTGQRTATLGAAAVRFLESLPRQRGQLWVFPSGRNPGEPMDRAEIRFPWARLCKAAGLSGVRVHDLRHAHASQAVQGGASLYQTGHLLGHKAQQTTARYAHIHDDDTRELADTVSEALDAALDGRVIEIAPKEKSPAKRGRKAAGA